MQQDLANSLFDSPDLREPSSRFLRRVVLRNYKSIAACDVRLRKMSFLVGPNGSGKSNFLDAIRFVADSLRASLDHALRDRGGIKEVRRRSSGHPTHFGIRLEYVLADQLRGHFAFDLAAQAHGGYSVQREECRVSSVDSSTTIGAYLVEEGKVRQSTITNPPAAAKDRLYLVNASGLPEFRLIYDAFSSMGFYNLNPDVVRELQSPDPGVILTRDGSNIASVVTNMAAKNPALLRRVEEYLSRIVPGISGVEPISIGPKETLQFRQEVSGAKHPWRFLAANMSDGTLRAFGVLVALFQSGVQQSGGIPFVGIEEPETALHPAAAGILTDSLGDASELTQVAVTSHSPDLLDNESIPDDAILAVLSDQGETKIGPLDAAGRTSLRDHLFTAGELLRMDQLRPEPGALALRPEQLALFGEG